MKEMKYKWTMPVRTRLPPEYDRALLLVLRFKLRLLGDLCLISKF